MFSNLITVCQNLTVAHDFDNISETSSLRSLQPLPWGMRKVGKCREWWPHTWRNPCVMDSTALNTSGGWKRRWTDSWRFPVFPLEYVALSPTSCNPDSVRPKSKVHQPPQHVCPGVCKHSRASCSLSSSIKLIEGTCPYKPRLPAALWV